MLCLLTAALWKEHYFYKSCIEPNINIAASEKNLLIARVLNSYFDLKKKKIVDSANLAISHIQGHSATHIN